MTRINADIPVQLLSDHHLRAEQKEIARLPLLFKSRDAKRIAHTEIPLNFTLGPGHLLFFMDKGQWVFDRLTNLTGECVRRGIGQLKVLNPRRIDNWIAYTEFSKVRYRWSNHDRILVINRIIDKMLSRIKDRENYGLSFRGEKEFPETTIKRLLESLT